MASVCAVQGCQVGMKRMRRWWDRFLARHTRLDRRDYKLVRVTVEYGHRYINLHFRGCHADDHEIERIRFDRSKVAYEIRCFKEKP